MKTLEKVLLFGTTLWFTKKDKTENMLDNVIACGEYTACYNLLSYVIVQYGNQVKEISLFNELMLLWKEFQETPKFLIEQRKQKTL